VEMFLRNRVRCTFAVIPFVCDCESLLKAGEVRLYSLLETKAALLKPLLKEGLAEIALHGYCHLTLAPVRGYQEFSDRMPVETQRRLIQKGRRHLEKLFGLKVRLYVPPWNRLAASTAGVLKEENLLLANDIPEIPDARIMALSQLPSATEIAQTEQALRMARRRGGKENTVGTMIHDYDFVESHLGTSTLDLEGFEKLLHRWKEMPGIRRQLISETILGAPADGGDRLRANYSFRNSLKRSRLGFKVLAGFRNVYWDAQTALRLAQLAKFIP